MVFLAQSPASANYRFPGFSSTAELAKVLDAGLGPGGDNIPMQGSQEAAFSFHLSSCSCLCLKAFPVEAIQP